MHTGQPDSGTAEWALLISRAAACLRSPGHGLFGNQALVTMARDKLPATST